MTILTNISSLLLVVVVVIIWKKLDSGIEVINDKNKEYTLVVSVLSARHHFQQRQAIRETWKKQVENQDLSKGVLFRFVVGKYPCEIPPKYRFDAYCCDYWNVSLPTSTETQAFLVSAGSLFKPVFKTLQTEVQFKVHHPVVVGALGILDEFLQNSSQPLQVQLSDLITGELLTSATFIRDSPGLLKHGYRYKHIEQYILPKSYEGLLGLFLENSKQYIPNVTVKTDPHETNIISFSKLKLQGKLKEEVPAVSFIYAVHEKEKLSADIEQEPYRQSKYQNHLMKEVADLNIEAEKFGDILFVNVVDVYRNLPQKLLEFLRWLREEHLQYDFWMKSDDDCFVDMELVFSSLQNFESSRNIWWGNFRDDWVVERFGKWAELDYIASVYPRFACGVGNLMSSDLTNWLAQNAHKLKMYQGEDVSMGIWMSAVAPEYMHDNRWQCNAVCAPGMLAMPEVSPQELKDLWSNKLLCNNPCKCH